MTRIIITKTPEVRYLTKRTPCWHCSRQLNRVPRGFYAAIIVVASVEHAVHKCCMADALAAHSDVCEPIPREKFKISAEEDVGHSGFRALRLPTMEELEA